MLFSSQVYRPKLKIKKGRPEGGLFWLTKQKLRFLEHRKSSSLVFGHLVSIWDRSKCITFLFTSEVIDLLLASSAEGYHFSMKEIGLTFAVCD